MFRTQAKADVGTNAISRCSELEVKSKAQDMSKLSLLLAIGVAGSALASSPVLAANQKPEEFIATAIQGDNSEIMMGQLAEQKGSTDQVRTFGKTLVSDHTAAKQEKATVAQQLNVKPSDAPKPEAGSMKSKLSGLSGAEFDRAFADAMVDDHQKDIAEYQEQSTDKTGPVGAIAGKQLPTLKKHLQMAQDIQKSSGTATSSQPTNGTAQGAYLEQEGSDLWRGSKLIGVNIYGPDNRKVGDINDVLVDKSGKIGYIVVGVGGFLGIGEKNVAIPFDRVSFSQERMTMAQTGAGVAPAPGLAPANTATGLAAPVNTAGGMAAPAATATVAGTAANAPAAMTPDVAPAVSTAYPDHGSIQETADQLKSAPTFHYAK